MLTIVAIKMYEIGVDRPTELLEYQKIRVAHIFTLFRVIGS